MDLYCRRCGEPWDNDSLHSAVEEGLHKDYKTASIAFRQNGCQALGEKCNGSVNSDRASGAGVIYDILGDDLDGAASMFDDFGFGL
jgi:hypothetical protein